MKTHSALCAILILASVALPAFGQKKDTDYPPLGSVKLEIVVTKVWAGNVVDCEMYFPWLGKSRRSIKALGYEVPGKDPRSSTAPELSPADEKKAKAAARDLQEVIDMGKVYAEPDGAGQHDPSGSGYALAHLWVLTDDGKLIDVAKWMKEKGHVLPAKPTKNKQQ